MIGSGWTWLVKYGKNNVNLRIFNTFNGATPFQEIRDCHYYESKFDRSNAIGSLIGSKKNTMTLFSNLINSKSRSELSAMDDTSENVVVPLLCLPLWEHAFVFDYKLNKEKYVDNFWSCINWNRVAIILNVY